MEVDREGAGAGQVVVMAEIETPVAETERETEIGVEEGIKKRISATTGITTIVKRRMIIAAVSINLLL